MLGKQTEEEEEKKVLPDTFRSLSPSTLSIYRVRVSGPTGQKKRENLWEDEPK